MQANIAPLPAVHEFTIGSIRGDTKGDIGTHGDVWSQGPDGQANGRVDGK